MQIIRSLSEIGASYDAVLVDLWGCLHNGLTAYPEAVEALRGFRKGGGTVVLLTNSPKPRAGVEKQIEGMGVSRDCWDTIATSGDAARAAMFAGLVGKRVFFIGEERDLPFFERMKILPDAPQIEIVPLDQAEGVVCTGPFDGFADPETLRPQLLYAKTKGMRLLCANPDIVVDRGESREWCAGAVARLYTEMGGESLYFGKPHPPIYDLARRRLAELGKSPEASRMLAIGDGIATDIQGALGEDIDSIFITGGLAAAETGTAPGGQPDPARVARYVDEAMTAPTYAMGFLR